MIEIRQSASDDLRDWTLETLDGFSADQGHPFIVTNFALEARVDGERKAGLVARMVQEWVFVELLAVADDARGHGLGARLVAEAEAEAIKRGAYGIWLDTFHFQAPGFYERLGYQEIGRLPHTNPARVRYFYSKLLASREGAPG